MMQLLGCIIITALIITITGEWVEIAQKQMLASTANPNKKILKQIEGNFFVNTDTTTPSALWLEYQRERFSNTENLKSQKLIVISKDHLKNSAQIVVPASIRNSYTNSSNQLKNRILKATTPMDVKEKINEKSQLGVEGEKGANLELIQLTDNVDKEDYHDGVGTGSNANNQLQFPSVQGFFKFLKSLRKTWIHKSGFGIDAKIKLLQTLRDNLMRTIEHQFTALWQPKEESQRRKRGLLEESNLNFPPEAALMSINFLTFAVFLIKLVLQVVHIVKSKHYSFAGFGTNTEAIGKTNLQH